MLDTFIKSMREKNNSVKIGVALKSKLLLFACDCCDCM